MVTPVFIARTFPHITLNRQLFGTLLHKDNADDNARNGFKRAENGCLFTADAQRTLLKQHHSSRGDRGGEQQAKSPAEERFGQGKLTCANTDQKQNHAAPEREIEAE